jgi:hypothetical protein
MVAVAALLGCATSQASISDIGNTRVEILPSGDNRVEITRADAYRAGDELVITGKAVRQRLLFTSDKGHIDIAVIGPGGEQVKLGTAEYRHHPSRQRVSSFKVRFPDAFEQGTKVRMIFHTLDGGGSKHLAALKMLGGEKAVCLSMNANRHKAAS